MRHQIFYWKSWYSPLRNKNFLYPKPFETQKGSSTKWFGTVIQNNFDGKSWYPPPVLSLTFFGTRNFLKHRRVPLLNDSALWDINFWQKIVILPPCLIQHFSITEINETLKDSSTKIYGTVRQKKLMENRDTTSILRRHKKFQYPKLLERQQGSSTNWFGIVRQNNFDRKTWNPPLSYP